MVNKYSEITIFKQTFQNRNFVFLESSTFKMLVQTVRHIPNFSKLMTIFAKLKMS